MKKRLIGLAFSLIMVVAIMGIMAGANKRQTVDPEIESVTKQAVLLHAGISDVVDGDGKYIEDALDSYKKDLYDVFSNDSEIAKKDFETRSIICETFDDTTDVVLDNVITDYEVRTYEENETSAQVVFDVNVVQKYIPCYDGEHFKAILCASRDQFDMTLVLENGKWKVTKMDLTKHDFGSPEDMGITKENYEKEFDSRTEACHYLESLNIEKILR